MTHYHVLSAKGLQYPLASLTFDNYEESLLTYVRLSTELFSKIVPEGDLSIDKAQAATLNGEASGIFIGNDNIAFVWMRCESECLSGTWN